MSETEAVANVATEAPAITQESVVTESVAVPAVVAPEVKVDEKLSSRFAALSKKQKQLDAQENSLKSKEQEISKFRETMLEQEARKAAAKDNPLKFIQDEYGLSYEDIAHSFVNAQVPDPVDPMAAKLAALEEKLAKQEALALEKENQLKAQDHEQKRNEYKSVIETDMKEYPLLSAYLSPDAIIETVTKHYQDTGEIKPHKEIMEAYESFYESKLEAISKIDKVKSKLGIAITSPIPETPKQAAPAKQDAKVPVTLSNQTGGSPIPIKDFSDMTPLEQKAYQVNKIKALLGR